ncbi:MAG: hypothetical protein ACOCQP_03045, partial [Lentisphaeria bacterium]
MKKKVKHFISLAEEGKLKCEECCQTLLLQNLEPLQLAKCGDCGAFNFIPKKISYFWLFQPLGGGGM